MSSSRSDNNNPTLKSRLFHFYQDLKRGRIASLEGIEKDHAKHVLYLPSEEKGAYEISIKDGKFSYKSDQTPLSSHHYILFVMDKKGTFYGFHGCEWKNYGRGFVGHPTFLAGGYVRMAGEFVILNGKLKYVFGCSGHYQPNATHMRQALFHFAHQGVDLQDVIVSIHNGNNNMIDYDHYHAKEFLEKHESNCVKFEDKNKIVNDVQKAIRTSAILNKLEDSPENNRPHRRK